MKFSEEGTLLATGGPLGVSIFDVENVVPVYKSPIRDWGTVTAVAWVSSNVLIYGTSAGHVIVCKKSTTAQPWNEVAAYHSLFESATNNAGTLSQTGISTITSSVSAGADRIIVCTTSGDVGVYAVTCTPTISLVYRRNSRDVSLGPITAAFVSPTSFDIAIGSTHHDGMIHYLETKTQGEVQTAVKVEVPWQIKIIYGKKCQTAPRYLLQDSVDGTVQQIIGQPTAHAPPPNPHPPIAYGHHIAFAEKSKSVVAGSPYSGAAQIICRRTGTVLDYLQQGTSGTVSVVAAVDTETGTLIATSMCEPDGATSVWL